jgi:hypothetical protein
MFQVTRHKGSQALEVPPAKYRSSRSRSKALEVIRFYRSLTWIVKMRFQLQLQEFLRIPASLMIGKMMIDPPIALDFTR